MIRIRFLGTAAARPTVRRNVAGIAVQREGESFLWDCGEGTQRQMMRYGTGFSFNHIFITHAHADHILGLPGLLRTMGLQGREENMTVYGPAGTEGRLREAVRLGARRSPFPVEVRGLESGARVEFEGWAVHAYRADHGVPALGYALVEEVRLGRFDPEAARRLGVPEGPLFGKLHRGEAVVVDGREVAPADVVGPPRRGRKVVYSGDTRPTPDTVEIARGAELLIHEATFGADEVARARETRHSTSAEAALVALRAGVQELVLTHISARYAENPTRLEAGGRKVFPACRVARDGLEIEIGYRDG
ncbi:MAG: ribonuclease Z [Gemmatimonadetes bacterium]|nr:ribonuclease Z [Gemmatimonadota bacterium]